MRSTGLGTVVTQANSYPRLNHPVWAAQMDKSEVRALYKNLHQKIEEILFRHDPIGLNFGSNSDEYAPEVGSILPRLKETRSEADVLNVIYEEFVQWFGEEIAGERDSQPYQDSAQEIWVAWTHFSSALA